MPTPFAITGLGRIGRALVRVVAERPELDLELVAVNDRMGPQALAQLLARDSLRGRFPQPVRVAADALEIGGRPVRAFCEEVPGAIPWQRTPARLVVEATGRATDRAKAAAHLRGAVERVVVAAIVDDADAMLCVGVNEAAYDPARHRVVSNASCTTHALAVVAKVLDERFGVRHALMNEVHSYTANQVLVDGYHPDPRRSRAAALNIVPTTSGAPAAVERLLPRLAGRLAGHAVRVPTPDGALLDVVATVERTPPVEELRAAYREAAAGSLAGVLAVSDEPLVSSDFLGERSSAVVDLPLVEVLGAELVRLAAWYDNEWGYAHRLAELVARIGGGPAA